MWKEFLPVWKLFLRMGELDRVSDQDSGALGSHPCSDIDTHWKMTTTQPLLKYLTSFENHSRTNMSRDQLDGMRQHANQDYTCQSRGLCDKMQRLSQGPYLHSPIHTTYIPIFYPLLLRKRYRRNEDQLFLQSCGSRRQDRRSFSYAPILNNHWKTKYKCKTWSNKTTQMATRLWQQGTGEICKLSYNEQEN